MTGQRALWLAAGGSLVLALGKVLAGLWTGSMVVLVSAADSFCDALMSAANGLGYAHARTPPDADHHYGHGKIEGALALGQGMLFVGVVASIVAGAIERLWGGGGVPVVGWAMATLAISAVGSGVLTWMLERAKNQDTSVILQADSAHYRIDLLAAAAGIVGLWVVGWTGWAWLDPVLSLVVAALMAQEAWEILREAGAELLDEAIPEDEVRKVEDVLAGYRAQVVEFHGLRTRRSGPHRFVEVHAVLDPELSFREVHRFVEELGQAIRAALPESTRALVRPDAAGLRDTVDEPLPSPSDTEGADRLSG